MNRSRAATVLLPLTLLASAAQAAVEYDSDSLEGGFNVARLAVDGSVGAGADRFLLVAITVSEGAPAVTAASFAGVPLAFVAGVTAPMAHCRVELWGLVAPEVGTHPLVIELPATVAHLGAAFLSYRGVSPVRPVGGLVSATGDAGPTTVTVVGAGAGDLVLDGVCAWSPDSVLEFAGSRQIGRWHWSTGALSAAGSEVAASPSVTMTWSGSGPGNIQWGAVGLALRSADGSAGRYPVRVDLDVESAGCALGHRGSPPAQARAAGIILMLLLGFRRRARASRAPRPPLRSESGTIRGRSR
jgi:hypothetical protein